MSAQKIIQCSYIIDKFSSHLKYKNLLLNLINLSPSENITAGVNLNITKSDWTHAKDFNRSWFKLIEYDLKNDISKLYHTLGYDKELLLNEIWFQQYCFGSEHGWHIHSSNFTGVYYLEFPKESPKTILIEPFTKNHFELDVKEGDIVLFPSFVIHKAPKNLSNKRKTIISFNSDAVLNYNLYNSKH